jgi:hypothetical protein
LDLVVKDGRSESEGASPSERFTFLYPFSTFYTRSDPPEHFPSVEHPGEQNQTSLDVLVGSAVINQTSIS